MDKFSKKQKIQEGEYDFPYHYIPTLGYKRFSQTIIFDWGLGYLSYINFILDIIKTFNFETLLDVGCGDGRFLHELGKKLKNKQVTGLDFSQRAIAFAKLMNSEIPYICEDITDTNLFSNQFDVIDSVSK